MSDLIVGLGLVLVIEGILWAAFPRAGRTMLEALTEVPEATLRSAAAAAVVVGVALVWLVRG
jgi:uncharacterized protein YjeT (DUF2065 family)